MLVFQSMGNILAEFGVEILDVWKWFVWIEIESERDRIMTCPCVVCLGFGEDK